MLLPLPRLASRARTSSLVLAFVASLGGMSGTSFSQETQISAGESPSEIYYQKAPDGEVPKAPNGGDNGADEGEGQNPDKDNPTGARQEQIPDKPQDNRRGRGDWGRGREDARPTFAEERLRQMMVLSGVTSRATQDAILEFLRNDEEGKQSIRDAGRNLWNGMRRDVPPERLQTLLHDYQKVMQTQREARLRAQTALDARVGYTLDAHLEAFLWLLGVLGDGQNLVGNQQFVQPRRGGRGVPFNVFPVLPFQNKERQIDGVVNAKNREGELPVWLEIRDVQGQLWRASPQGEPAAIQILSRQIQTALVGDRVTVRVGPAQVVNGNTPLPLLAIIPVAKAGADIGGANPPDN